MRVKREERVRQGLGVVVRVLKGRWYLVALTANPCACALVCMLGLQGCH